MPRPGCVEPSIPLVAAYYSVRRYIRPDEAMGSTGAETGAGVMRRGAAERCGTARPDVSNEESRTARFWFVRGQQRLDAVLVRRRRRGFDAAVPSDRSPWRRAAALPQRGQPSSLSSWL